MDPRYTIALARPEHVALLPEIERAAGELFRGRVALSLLNDTTDETDLREAQAAGHLWVALCGDAPVGFAVVELLAPDLPHLEEIDVHPEHGRRGIGAALVHAVADWASRARHEELTLTTFRAIPWNMPFYARLGFEELRPESLRPELVAVVADEAARGLDPAERVVMRLRLPFERAGGAKR
ncbi:MAG: GNAT family N-acetyltransferase [Deltaproteobacteria bacterium]|nr:GNAT family N-acetyltransferase [Deltaproteobacteria bacterium]